MDYYNISIKQLISEIKRKEAEIANMKSKLKGYEEQKRNIEILGMQNKRWKKDNERYRKILDQTPKKAVKQWQVLNFLLRLISQQIGQI